MAQKMSNMALIDSDIIIAIGFRMFDLTSHQDKECLAFFSRKNIIQSLYGEIVRYKPSTS